MDIRFEAASHKAVPVINNFLNRFSLPHFWSIQKFCVTVERGDHWTNEYFGIAESSNKKSRRGRTRNYIWTIQHFGVSRKTLSFCKDRAPWFATKKFRASARETHFCAGALYDYFRSPVGIVSYKSWRIEPVYGLRWEQRCNVKLRPLCDKRLMKLSQLLDLLGRIFDNDRVVSRYRYPPETTRAILATLFHSESPSAVAWHDEWGFENFLTNNSQTSWVPGFCFAISKIKEVIEGKSIRSPATLIMV